MRSPFASAIASSTPCGEPACVSRSQQRCSSLSWRRFASPSRKGRAAVGALLYGSLSFGAAFALFYYALVELQAGFGQIVLALIPLATLLLAVLQGQERLRFAAVTGALIGLAGIVLMSRTSLPDTVPLVSLLAAVGGALCVAQAAVLVRRFPRVHPVTMNAVGMATGGVLLLARIGSRRRVASPSEGRRDLGCARLSRRRRLGSRIRALSVRARALECVAHDVLDS